MKNEIKVQIRMTRAERERGQAAAAAAGHDSLSECVRLHLDRLASKHKIPKETDQ